ncbi:MAG TPA: SAM-dependent methyltransferase, partial [Cyanobacteria bacterium UBA11049]|nr:SAM-dependent methyltransferase [Cyanobacteria bacterium UBA11049]
MNASTMLQDIEKYIPVVGDVNLKIPFAYKATREVVGVVNTAQMAVAEAYINGL